MFYIIALTLPAAAQKIAVLSPEKTPPSSRFAESFSSTLAEKLVVLDHSLSEAAYSANPPATPFNLTTTEAKRLGSAIGCEVFVLVRSATERRSSSQRSEYYESYAAVYVVSTRSGRLVFWKLARFEDTKPAKAERQLASAIARLAGETGERIIAAMKSELAEPGLEQMEEVPDENSPAAKNFRAPVPYRRIKPAYTNEAALYDVAATVEIVVDLDAAGLITRTESVRWAGFGLDESVEATVRAMNWRPAMRADKPLPMRFLLRYNFRKTEKE